MVKWKRKKYLLAPDPQEEEEFSPLGLSLLEHFASGMSAPWQQWFEEFCFWCASFQASISICCICSKLGICEPIFGT